MKLLEFALAGALSCLAVNCIWLKVQELFSKCMQGGKITGQVV
jgi:hypothetical protein